MRLECGTILRDVDSHIMSGVRVGQDASAFHDCRDVKFSKEIILPWDGTKNSNGFPEGNMKNIGPMKTANSCRDGIQNRILCQLEFANAEIPWTSVETETNISLP